MVFIYNYSHFKYSFCNQPVLFAHLENVNKLWKNNRTMQVNERNQNKNKVMSDSNWPRVLLFDLAHKQCICIIKGWLHCLTSESEGRFLVNILLAWCLVMTQIQFSLIIKKNKDRTSGKLANPPPPCLDNIPFLSYLLPTPLKVDVICVSPHIETPWIDPCFQTIFRSYYRVKRYTINKTNTFWEQFLSQKTLMSRWWKVIRKKFIFYLWG